MVVDLVANNLSSLKMAQDAKELINLFNNSLFQLDKSYQG